MSAYIMLLSSCRIKIDSGVSLSSRLPAVIKALPQFQSPERTYIGKDSAVARFIPGTVVVFTNEAL
jgi:hypothetical protein